MNKKILTAVMLVGAVTLSAPSAYAALTATSVLSQVIDAGTISTDIRDESNNVLSNPTFNMTGITLSTSQQSATGTFGTAEQRISIDNPGGANGGWSLALNATNPGTDVWTSGANSYDFNAATAAGGQLTVNPSVGTITPVTGTTTGITLGASSTFSSNAAITLVNAAAASDDIWNGYVTGIGLSQTVPANQPAGTYTIPMTQTLTVL